MTNLKTKMARKFKIFIVFVFQFVWQRPNLQNNKKNFMNPGDARKMHQKIV